MSVSPKPCEPGDVLVERGRDTAVARLAVDLESCPECRGTGLVRTHVQERGRTYEAVARCPKAKLLDRTQRFNEARLPAVHATSSFETWKPKNSEQARAYDVARGFCLRYPEAKGFILSGPVGTGKTHLLVAAVRHLTLELGVRTGYVELSFLYAQIRRGFQDGKSGGEIIQPLAELEVLAIDELGKGRGSAFELQTLDELIAKRYDAGRRTLFATNYSLKAPEERAQRGLVDTATLLEAGKDSKLLCDRVGDRIYSRLCEMCDFVEFPAATPDARRTTTQVGRPRS